MLGRVARLRLRAALLSGTNQSSEDADFREFSMKRLLGAAVLAALVSGAAFADDVPVKELPAIEGLQIGDSTYFAQAKLISRSWVWNSQAKAWVKDGDALRLVLRADQLEGVRRW